MSGALLYRFFRDGAGLLVLLLAATAGMEVALMAVLGDFSRQEHMMLMRQEFVQRMFRALAGAEFTPDISATSLMSLGFTHPVVYALSWSYLLTAATRVPAAEIERGTADLLLSLPLTRSRVYASVSIHLVIAAALFSAAALAGAWLGNRIAPLWEPLDFARLRIVAVNQFGVHLCVSLAALLASSWCSRRGPAIVIVLGWLLASLLLEFFGPLAPTVERFSRLGLLHYYRPLLVARAGDWPTAHLLVLSAIALVCWIAGWLRFRIRDIPAA